MPYPEQMVAPMRAELVEMGVQELRTSVTRARVASPAAARTLCYSQQRPHHDA